MEFNKQISFRPTPEFVKELVFLANTENQNETSVTTFFNTTVCNALNSYNKIDFPDEKSNIDFNSKIETLETRCNELEKVANDNAIIAARLELENQALKENSNHELELFSDENKYKLWCILQIFKKIYPQWTFEDMIFFIIKSYQEAGYLNLENSDLNYIETIKENYNGTL